MTLRVCLDCTTTYAVGITLCPHCRSERAEEQGHDPYRGGTVPKITRHGGTTNAGAAVAEEPAAAPVKGIGGGEEPSPGSSSETSTEKAPSTPEPSETSRRSPARTTASRSKKARGESGTADSTDTSGHETAAADAESETK